MMYLISFSMEFLSDLSYIIKVLCLSYKSYQIFKTKFLA